MKPTKCSTNLEQRSKGTSSGLERAMRTSISCQDTSLQSNHLHCVLLLWLLLRRIASILLLLPSLGSNRIFKKSDWDFASFRQALRVGHQ